MINNLEDIILFKVDKRLSLFLVVLLLLIVIPSSFAHDNDTSLTLDEESPVAIESIDDVEPLSEGSNDYYFDASAENDTGDGSIDNPYKYLTAERIKANANIYLADGEYDLNQQKSIDQVNFIGSGQNTTVIKYTGVAFKVWNSLTLTNLTISDATIMNYNKLNATNTVFTQACSSSRDSYGNNFGGAIYSPYYSSSYTPIVNLVNCTFSNNYAEYGGAIYMDGGSLNINDTMFIDNFAYNFGGAIAAEYGTKISIARSKFYNSYSMADAGGAIYLRGSELKLANVNIANSSATFGGAITSLNSHVSLNYLNVNDCSAKWDGGAVYHMYGNFSSYYGAFTNNSANNGGAIFVDNSTNFILRNNQFTNNNANLTAGAVYSICNTLKGMASVKQYNRYNGNKAFFKDNEYEISSLNLTIGNGNYTMYKNNASEITNLPSYYSLRDYNLLTIPKDQQSSGNCWAFTALAVLESNILKAAGESLDLSEENMKNVIAQFSDYGWDIETNEGGYDSMPIGYLVGWLGPVHDSEDVFDDHGTLSPVLNSLMHVQNVVYLKRDNYLDNDAIKKAIMQYGAVGTSMLFDNNFFRWEGYYCWSTTSSNHAVTIVGWDDNYSRNHFYGLPQDKGDGAWIVRNSWGPNWNDNGYFYVSYYDEKLAQPGKDNMAYTFILNDTIKYDKNYQYDIAGKTDFYYKEADAVWYKNIFHAENDEFLAGISTYFEKVTNWTASVYVNGEMKANAEGTSNPGYYTIDLGNFVSLNVGYEFEVEFKVCGSDVVSFPISEKYSLNKLIYKPGISFISLDGENWFDLYNYSGSYPGHTYTSQVACIKAFTFLNEINTTTILDVLFDGIDSINLTSSVIDQYGNLLNGIMTYNINGIEYDVALNNGISSLNDITLYNAQNTITATFSKVGYKTSIDEAVIYKSKTNVTIDASIDQSPYDVLINIVLNEPINETLTVIVNNKTYSVKSLNGNACLELDNLESGEYSVAISLDNADDFNCDDCYLNFSYVAHVDTVLSAEDLNMAYKDGSKFIARLTDINNSPISGALVKVNNTLGVYRYRTDDDGYISVPMTNLKPGEYVIYTFFEGNDTYGSANLNSSVIVDKALVLMEADDVNVVYKEGGNFLVRLTDVDGKAISGVYVWVNNGKTTSKYKTNADGVATVPINLKPGNYNFTVSFDGNSIYGASNMTGLVVVDKAAVFMESNGANVVYKENGSLAVRLTDVDGNPISGVTVKFDNGKTAYRYRTDSDGVATAPLNLKPGNYSYNLIFEGNSLYGAANMTTLVVVDKAAVFMETSEANVIYKEDGSLAVRLTDVDGNPISGVTVKFDNGKTAYRYHTDSDGVATAPINLKPGNYSYNISFAGNSMYNSACINGSVVVQKARTIVSAEDFVMTYQDNSNWAVRLTDVEGNAISGVTVKFDNGKNVYRYHTDADGVATAPIKLKPGSYNFTISFDGNSLYDAVNITKSLVVNKIDTQMVAQDVNMTFKDGTNYTIELSDINGNAVSGVTVKVNNTLRVYKYKTDSNGVAIVPINLKPGEYEFIASFEGNDIYNPINMTSRIVIMN